jgi:quercetin dioxygenase-like cupin family protein
LKEDLVMSNQVQVVPREAIRPIHSVQHGAETHTLGELRDFAWHDALKEFMPPQSEFSMSWVRLGPGETLSPHVHPIQSLMIFYAGSGKMLGAAPQTVDAGSVVVVPPGCEHGFTAGPEGLAALSIQFGDGLYTNAEKPRVIFSDQENSLASLLAYNERRMEEFGKRPIFQLLADGTLDNEVQRKVYLEHLQLWVNGNQTLLFARQASCRDNAFGLPFLQHMQEELGHDDLHADRADQSGSKQPEVNDAILAAITSWFTYQMYIRDNADKTAIIHLVIENASNVYHRHAAPALAKYVNNRYFDVHIEGDDAHAALGAKLLANESPQTYARLREVIGEAWDMIGAMTDRLVEVTRKAAER